MPMSCDDALVGGDPAPVAFAKGKTKAQILAAVKATGFIVGAGRTDTEGEWLPPLFEARELDGCLERRFLHRLQPCLREQFAQVAFAGSSELGFVLRFGIERAGTLPERGQRCAIAGMVPDAHCDDPTGTCHARHFAQPSYGVSHEMDDELRECRVEDAVGKGQAFSRLAQHLDRRVARFRCGDEGRGWVDCRDCLPADPPNKLACKRAWAAAHVQHTLPRTHSAELGQLG